MATRLVAQNVKEEVIFALKQLAARTRIKQITYCGLKNVLNIVKILRECCQVPSNIKTGLFSR